MGGEVFGATGMKACLEQLTRQMEATERRGREELSQVLKTPPRAIERELTHAHGDRVTFLEGAGRYPQT
eukprot:5901657-Amphidinium_carterae.1